MKEKHRKMVQAGWALLTKEPSSWRYLKLYVNSYEGGHQPFTDEYPLITLRALQFLRRELKPNAKVFEYGAGGSTFFFARRCRSVVSIEHDTRFHQIVCDSLKERGLSNVECFHVPPEPDPVAEEAKEDFVTYKAHPHRKEFSGLNFVRYVKAIDPFADESFDVILVDGRARASCVYEAWPKLKVGGILILDDSNRSDYQEAKLYLKSRAQGTDFYGARPHHATMGFHTATSVYRKEN
jgi:predicted O-methyltransferase YrrM